MYENMANVTLKQMAEQYIANLRQQIEQQNEMLQGMIRHLEECEQELQDPSNKGCGSDRCNV